MGLSAASNYGQRSRFRVRRLYDAQLERFQRLLYDLLPPSVANIMITTVERPPPETCHAAVLQLDICRFTELSRTLPPLKLARLVHSLFTHFDAAVRLQKLFKADTIGDAYVVACFVDPYSSAGLEGLRSMLAAAYAMLQAIEEVSANSEHKLTCRIGMAMGTVTTGVLGQLQTRFHVQGPALQAAEILEQTSPMENTLHVSKEFLEALAPSSDDTCPPDWFIQAESRQSYNLGLSPRNMLCGDA